MQPYGFMQSNEPIPQNTEEKVITAPNYDDSPVQGYSPYQPQPTYQPYETTQTPNYQPAGQQNAPYYPYPTQQQSPTYPSQQQSPTYPTQPLPYQAQQSPLPANTSVGSAYQTPVAQQSPTVAPYQPPAVAPYQPPAVAPYQPPAQPGVGEIQNPIYGASIPNGGSFACENATFTAEQDSPAVSELVENFEAAKSLGAKKKIILGISKNKNIDSITMATAVKLVNWFVYVDDKLKMLKIIAPYVKDTSCIDSMLSLFGAQKDKDTAKSMFNKT